MPTRKSWRWLGSRPPIWLASALRGAIGALVISTKGASAAGTSPGGELCESNTCFGEELPRHQLPEAPRVRG
jgi:hypothetical protein